MGHVPSRPFSREGAGADISRRERREAREDGAEHLTDHRLGLGATGEDIACWWLSSRGLVVERRNVAVDGGEVDIVARDGNARVVVEVRTLTGPGDPIDAVGHAKRAQVSRLAGVLGASRVDFLGLGLRPWGMELHWVPGSAR